MRQRRHRPVITTMVVAEQSISRAGVRAILDAEADIEVVAEAVDVVGAVDAALESLPCVAVIDLDLGGGTGGLEAGRQIVAACNARSITPPGALLVAPPEADVCVTELLTAGVRGLLYRSSDEEHLVTAVRTIAAGGLILAPTAARRLISDLVGAPSKPAEAATVTHAALQTLTDREREVLMLVAQGYPNRRIGELIHVSEVTVKSHVGRAMLKLGARSRVQLTIAAYEAGLVSTIRK